MSTEECVAMTAVRFRPRLISIACIVLLVCGTLPATATLGQRDAEPDCDDGWASLASEEFPGKFRVWTTCTGEYEDDLEEALEIIESFWGPMTGFMGIEPIPDDGSERAGGDTAIDFYAVNPGENVPSRGLSAPDMGIAAYAAPQPSDEAESSVSSSSAVVLRRAYMGDPFLYFVLVHEFFHVLQQARNWELAFNWATRPDDDPDWDTLVNAEHWWTEAGAEWAAFHFTRDIAEQDATRRSEHRNQFKFFLDTSPDISLHAPQQQDEPGWQFMYSTYIWFYFMEQEIGLEAIAEIWEEFAGLGPNDTEEAMAIIDAELPFEVHFRDFAVRNLNLELEPGDPIDPSYDNLDPEFPTLALSPPLIVGEDDEDAALPILAADDEPRLFADRIRSLTAHYYRFEPDPRGGQLLLDFSGLAPASALDIDVLLKIEDGEWERRRLAAGGAATFCLSDPSEEVEELYLILSNHDRDLYSIVEGEFTAKVIGEHCDE
jgi:hypothetical protein